VLCSEISVLMNYKNPSLGIVLYKFRKSLFDAPFRSGNPPTRGA
jgi:hypothetical protein